MVSQDLITAFWTMIMRQNNNRLQVAAIIVIFVAGALMFTTSSTYNIANAQGGQQ
jgi:tryptophan-rich sensory protein